MADDSITPTPGERPGAGGRGGRPPGNREPGGFRIRLSDNEMQAARAVQEAFGLRSIVAVLGFSLRTLAQQLEEGQLDELIARHRSQGGARSGGGRREDRRREPTGGGGGTRVDPFARPSRPAPAAAEVGEDAAESPPLGEAQAAEASTAESGGTEEPAGTEADRGDAA